MPWWLQRVVDFLNWIGALLWGKKLEALSRSISPDASVPQPPGTRFISVQVDGLSHEYLLRAMAMGHLPTLQGLIAAGHQLQGWRCGVPSTTPAVQAGLMYGNNWDIPAFRWYEKDSGFAPVCRIPSHVERIKERVANGRPGILSGGSSYANMWDGDARLALFTLSAMGRQHFFEHLRGLGWFLLFVLIPWRTLRIILISTYEVARDWGRGLANWARSGFRSRPRLVKPVLQTLTNIVMSEIQTFGVVLDIYRGMPAILTNFYGYDEVAHSDGPLGKEALRALRRIDRRVREIERARRMFAPAAELYIYSDHGMSPSIPFRSLAGQVLGEVMADHVRATVVWDPDCGSIQSPGPETLPNLTQDGRLWLLDELAGMEGHLSARGQRLVELLRNYIIDRLPPDPELGWDPGRSCDVIVRVSGNLAHVYFNVTQATMDVSELAILYPGLLDALTDRDEFGAILGREGGQPVIVTQRGTATLSGGWLPPGLRDPDQSAGDLARLLSFPHSGDLVLLGAWNHRGEVVTFEEQWATHGGIGGPQSHPFFLVPPDAPLDAERVTNSEQLYPYFLQRFQRAAPLPPGNGASTEEHLVLPEAEPVEAVV